MSGLKTLYNLLLKDTVKGSGQASGIMSIGDSVRKLAKRKFEAYVATAQRQGVDLDKLSEEQIKYMLELNKPKAPKVYSNEEAYEILSRFANQNKTGKVIKADFGKPFKEEIGSVDNIINDITRMEPIAAMKEVNKVLGKKGKYKNLSKQDSEKVFNDFNTEQADKVVSGVNSECSEVFWFYPSSSASDNDRYVVYNYGEKVWYFGTLARTAWLDRGTRSFPIAAGGQYLYNHEIGFDDDGSAMTAFIESAGIDIGDGDKFSYIRRIVPDLTFTGSTSLSAPQAVFTIKARRFPGADFSDTESGTA